MAKLWTANKTWQGNTTPVAGTKYLVGAASGKCSYQTFDQPSQTKRCLVSNGANGNLTYQSITSSPTMGSVDISTAIDINNIREHWMLVVPKQYDCIMINCSEDQVTWDSTRKALNTGPASLRLEADQTALSTFYFYKFTPYSTEQQNFMKAIKKAYFQGFYDSTEYYAKLTITNCRFPVDHQCWLDGTVETNLSKSSYPRNITSSYVYFFK